MNYLLTSTLFVLTLNLLLFKNSSENKVSSDLNLNWHELETNTKASLRGLYVVDEKVIWASGVEGTVLLSVDGGKNWKVIKVAGQSENDFRSIHAWNKKRALVFGVAGPDFGFLTEDGGESWNVVFRDTTDGLFFNSLNFANDKIGLAVSDPVNEKPFIIKTNDGGKSWKSVSNIPNSKDGEANFAASNTCIEFLPTGKAWIVTGGSVARVFYSEDFGESWKITKTPVVQGKPSSGIFSVCFKNDLEGVIVGGTYDKPELNDKIAAYTTDGGKNWSPSDKMPKAYRSCVQYIAGDRVAFFFAIGKTGCDFSLDGGRKWDFISEEGYYTFRPIPGKSSGFTAGSNGRIAMVNFK